MSFASDRILQRVLEKAAANGFELPVVDGDRDVYEFYIDGRPDSYLTGKRYRFTITFGGEFPWSTPRFHDPDGRLCHPMATGQRDSPVTVGRWHGTQLSKLLNYLAEELHHPNPDLNHRTHILNERAVEQLRAHAAKEEDPGTDSVREIPPDFIASVNRHYARRC